MGEPLMGGWGAAPDADGINGMFCCGNGETFNIPVELTEARYGLQVDQYAFSYRTGRRGKYSVEARAWYWITGSPAVTRS